MKASELRIGNYVTIDNNENWEEIKHIPMVVISIKYKEEGNYSISVDMAFEEDLFYNGFSQYERFIEPIPLTEEWLLKFGFKNDIENNWFKITIGSEAIPILVRIWNEKKIQVYYHWNFQGMNHIGYVENIHQLQNLVFALTNKELTIK